MTLDFVLTFCLSSEDLSGKKCRLLWMSPQDTPSYLSPGCGVAGQELSLPCWGDTPAKVGSHPEATWGSDLGGFTAGPRASGSLPGDAFQPRGACCCVLATPKGGMSGKSWGRHEEGLAFRARKEPVVYRQAGDKDLPAPRVTPPQKCQPEGRKA